jgi:benzodiazapine receptor
MEFIKKLIIIFSPLLLGFLSGISTTNSINTWYKFLIKPTWNPPNWIFGPVWSILYFLMGLAAYFVFIHSPRSNLKRTFYILFYIQLFFNLIWSPIFFNLQLITFALVWIIILWLLITTMLFYVKKLNLISFYILLPYWLWVGFAAFLNFSIVQLN